MTDFEATFVAMALWPYPLTPVERQRHRPFSASWQDTLDLLGRELKLMQASNVVLGCGMKQADIRKDGWPRANAAQPTFPGVEIGFDSDMLIDPLQRKGQTIVARYGGDVRAAQRATHPDAGGNAEDFAAVMASVEKKRLVYATDSCDRWQDNVRSIALGLEALRAVDRFGISREGQQYAGFRAALTTGVAR